MCVLLRFNNKAKITFEVNIIIKFEDLYVPDYSNSKAEMSVEAFR